MIDKLIEKIGTDKLLHFAFGAVIAFVMTNILMLQEGSTGSECIVWAVAGIAVAMTLECIKEFCIDGSADKKDILATFIGAIVPLIANSIGVWFNVLSN